jgi:hypothetical protein
MFGIPGIASVVVGEEKTKWRVVNPYIDVACFRRIPIGRSPWWQTSKACRRPGQAARSDLVEAKMPSTDMKIAQVVDGARRWYPDIETKA